LSNAVLGLTVAAVEQPVKYTYDKGRGYTTSRSWKGTEAQIRALEVSYQAWGWSTEVRQGPIWSMTATLGADERSGQGGETPVDTWELFANTTEKELLSSTVTGVKTLSDARMSCLRSALDGKIDFVQYDCSTQAKTPAAIYGDAASTMLYRLIRSGVRHDRIVVPTLRHTKTASRDYEFEAAVSEVGSIFKTESLRNYNVMPSWIYNNLPQSPAANPLTRTDGVIVYWGWNKHYPQISVSAYGKSQIVTEWEYGAWSTTLYPTNL
jgi:hypothetical protein